QAVNASDVAGLLQRSLASTGVETQQRNEISSDPRIRGLRIGQYTTYADGGYFLPARLDLDTAVSKYDARSVANVIVIKGPYSVRYGPGFAFLDIATYDTPRYQDGFKVEGRTYYNYQTNGQPEAFLQSVQGGEANWGFRITSDFRVGNDYLDGNENRIPSSYNSENVNFALGYTFSEDSRIEFKALRLYQHDIEFPGLFFDISRLNTEAYSVRYALNNQRFWHRLGIDLWYNYTGANGDTHQGAKKAFIDSFLSSPINFGTPTNDFSNTYFSESSRGYRAVMGWGKENCTRINVGSDLNYVDQF